MGPGRPTADKLVVCSPSGNFAAQRDKVRQCVLSAPSADASRGCLTESLGGVPKGVGQCLAGAKTNPQIMACFDQTAGAMAQTRGVMSCMAAHGSPLACGSGLVSKANAPTMDCFASAGSQSARLKCAASANPELSRVQSVTGCVDRGLKGPQLAACISPLLGGDTPRLTACMSSPNPKIDACLAGLNPQVADTTRSFACLTKSGTNVAAFGCIAPRVGSDAARVTNCLSNPDRDAAALCLVGDSAQARAVQRAYKCISAGKKPSDVLANCTEGLIDGKSRIALSCITKAGGDRTALAACAAPAVLPPDAARLVACAASSQGATYFALCAAAPAMNEEWRIAAECAVQSGGEPLTFGGCTAGRLTLRELTKCFTGQIGKDCYGPNNTIVVTLRNAVNDLTHGPGENNEVVKAVRAVGDLTGGPNSVINNPAQLTGGHNSMINNLSQIWGGPDSVFNKPGQLVPNSIPLGTVGGARVCIPWC